MRKFKAGEMAYIEVMVTPDGGADYYVKHVDGMYGHVSEENIFSKKEMLKKLTTPELPKVGDTYQWNDSDGDLVKVIYINSKYVAYEYQKDNELGTWPIKPFMKDLIKVES